jgi:hypothetical protein
VPGRSRRARNVIWLTPESLHAAERLSSLTGMPVADLIEMVLLELMQHEGLEARPAPERTARRGPARVIPIGRARSAHATPASATPTPGDLDDLRRRCHALRAQAERARLASARAREHASEILGERNRGERGGSLG